MTQGPVPGSPSTAAHRLDARPSGPLLDFSEGRVRGGEWGEGSCRWGAGPWRRRSMRAQTLRPCAPRPPTPRPGRAMASSQSSDNGTAAPSLLTPRQSWDSDFSRSA
ncbi:hypothetical protein GCM10010433_71590 [Streptomyces pulveraceus]